MTKYFSPDARKTLLTLSTTDNRPKGPMVFLFICIRSLTVVSVCVCQTIQSKQMTRLPALDGYASGVPGLARIQTPSKLKCAMKCDTTVGCVSFFYNTASRMCQLESDIKYVYFMLLLTLNNVYTCRSRTIIKVF